MASITPAAAITPVAAIEHRTPAALQGHPCLENLLNARLNGLPFRVIRDFQPLSIAFHHALLKLCWIEVSSLPPSTLIVIIIVVLVLALIAVTLVILRQTGGCAGRGEKESEHARDRRHLCQFAH